METLEFKAELKQLLHLITHSLYSDRDIFLRELISNASDAINKIRFDSLANEAALEGNKDWQIRITPNKDAKTLTISDNGIGMTREEVITNLGTIAQSGTRAFLEAARQKSAAPSEVPGLIGQFGVGFYSAFMVADKVTVITRPAGDPKNATRWESDGQGAFTIETVEKPTRGTEVILHLKEDALEYLEPWKLKSLVRKFSDFIEHPVMMPLETEKDGKTEVTEEVVNRRVAIWLRQKSEVKPEEYNEFYKQISHDSEPPAKVIHYTAEGKHEFRVLAFIPAHKPLAWDYQEPVTGLRLYVQRVLIMDRCEEVLPFYLRFVKGVVDSSDLPLNVSREMLQQNPLLEVIQKSVVKNVLDALAGMKNTEYEKYVTFFKGLGSVLKEGLARDWSNRERIADLLLFESLNSEPGQFTTLANYVEKMSAEQEAIYYLIGDSTDSLRHSPYLEAFKSKGYDVLLLADPIDEFALPYLHEYKGKELRAANRGELKTADAEIDAQTQQAFAAMLAAMKEKLPEVSDVRLTSRLTESAACLVADAGAMTAHMERLLEKLGQGKAGGKRVLELNPKNPAVLAARQWVSQDAERFTNYARLFYEQALLAEGSPLPNPAAFAKRLNELITRDARTAENSVDT